MANATPTRAIVDGRSPTTSAQPTGITAAITVVSGATTPIWPMARPW